jgi:hypothetical protein
MFVASRGDCLCLAYDAKEKRWVKQNKEHNVKVGDLPVEVARFVGSAENERFY